MHLFLRYLHNDAREWTHLGGMSKDLLRSRSLERNNRGDCRGGRPIGSIRLPATARSLPPRMMGTARGLEAPGILFNTSHRSMSPASAAGVSQLSVSGS